MKKLLGDPVLLILATGMIYAAMLQGAVREPVFFSGDAGVKLLMTRQLADGRPAIGLRLPGAPWVHDLWTQGYYPFKKPFVHAINGQVVPAFPLTFPLITAPFYKIFGLRGLYILPFAALLVIWLSVYFFSLRLPLHLFERAFVMAALVFASHATIYSALFWEHLPSVALSTLGCCIVLHRDRPPPGLLLATVSGILMGLSGWLRPEGIIFFGAAGVVWGCLCLSRRQGKPWLCFAAGGSSVVLLFFITNLILYGYSLGPHAIDVTVGRSMAVRLAEIPGIAGELLSALLLFAPLGLLAFAYALRICLPGSPVLPATRSLSMLALISLIFFAAVVLILPNSGGLQWGPRYLLHIIPLGAVATGLLLAAVRAIGTATERRAIVACACILMAYGAWKNTVQGSRMLFDNYRNRISPAVQHLLQKDPVPVVCFDQYVPQEMACLLGRQPFFTLPQSSAPTRSLLAVGEKIFMAGQSRFFFIATDYQNRPPAMRPLLLSGPPVSLQFEPSGRFGSAYYFYDVTIAP